MTRRGWILSALAGLLVAGGPVWPAMAVAQTIKVGAVVPLTGRYAAPGGQVRADGTMDPNRTQPNQAGFGAATSAYNLRTIQGIIRFNF